MVAITVATNVTVRTGAQGVKGTPGGSVPHAPTHSAGAADPITVENLATAGTVGQVPTSDGAGTLTMASPSNGQSNDLVNAGTGVSLAATPSKVGVDLQLQGLASTTDRITVGTDVPNKNATLTLNEGNIVHQNISGSGTNTHAQIDSHLASSANPHAVTAAQAGADPTGTAASAVSAHDIDTDAHANLPVEKLTTAGTNGQVPTSDGAGNLVMTTPAGAGNVSSPGGETAGRITKFTGSNAIAETTVTETELDTLTDGSDADALHAHALADAHIADMANPHGITGNEDLITGVLRGGLMTINAGDPALFDIASVDIVIVDWTTGFPVRTSATFGPFIGETVPILAAAFTNVFVTAAGALVKVSGAPPTPTQRKTLARLQAVLHSATEVTGFSTDRGLASQATATLIDYVNKIGVINENNRFFEAATDLTVAKNAGTTTLPFVNSTIDTQDAATKVNASVASYANVPTIFRDGVGGFISDGTPTGIQPSLFDDNSGTLAAVPNNRFTVQRFHFSGVSDSFALTMGQATYANQSDAIASINTENPDIPANLETGQTIITTFLVIKEGTTDLSTADALFLDNTSFTGGAGTGQAPGTWVGLLDTSGAFGGNAGRVSMVNALETLLELTQLDHTLHLLNVGTNTHAQIDTHIADMANPHGTDLGNIGSGTLAELNIAVTDATLDDSGDARTPTAHASTHNDGQSDAITGAALETTITPAPTNYTPTANTIKGQFGGVDNSLGALSTTISDHVGNVSTTSPHTNPMLALRTGARNGGFTTIVTGTTFTVSDGDGFIVDNATTPGTPVPTPVSWSGITGVTATNIGTAEFTVVSIDSAGSLVQGTTLTPQDRRDKIVLAIIGHNGAVLTNVEQLPNIIYEQDTAFADFMGAVGIFNAEGNDYSRATVAALGLDVTSGSLYFPGINLNDTAANRRSPNFKSQTGGTDISWTYIRGDGSGGITVDSTGVTDINVTQRDDGAGGLTNLTGNGFKVDLIFRHSDGGTVVQFGSIQFASLSDAVNAAITTADPLLGTDFIFRYALVVKRNTTDLNTATDAQFIEVIGIGGSASSGGGGGDGAAGIAEIQVGLDGASSAVAIGGTPTSVAMDFSAVTFDATVYTWVTSNTDVTVDVSGRYEMILDGSVTSTSAGTSIILAEIFNNGSPITNARSQTAVENSTISANGFTVTRIADLTAGNVVGPRFTQTSGAGAASIDPGSLRFSLKFFSGSIAGAVSRKTDFGLGIPAPHAIDTNSATPWKVDGAGQVTEIELVALLDTEGASGSFTVEFFFGPDAGPYTSIGSATILQGELSGSFTPGAPVAYPAGSTFKCDRTAIGAFPGGTSEDKQRLTAIFRTEIS